MFERGVTTPSNVSPRATVGEGQAKLSVPVTTPSAIAKRGDQVTEFLEALSPISSEKMGAKPTFEIASPKDDFDDVASNCTDHSKSRFSATPDPVRITGPSRLDDSAASVKVDKLKFESYCEDAALAGNGKTTTPEGSPESSAAETNEARRPYAHYPSNGTAKGPPTILVSAISVEGNELSEAKLGAALPPSSEFSAIQRVKTGPLVSSPDKGFFTLDDDAAIFQDSCSPIADSSCFSQQRQLKEPGGIKSLHFARSAE